MMNLETPMPVTSMNIPEGDPGTEATIVQMRRLIDAGAKDPLVHELAAQIVRGVRAFDWMGEAQAIYNWVRKNIRFTRDVRGKETLHAAREIIRLGIGDCDDYTILICALASSVGAKCRIITVSSDPRVPEVFSHVYPEVSIGGRWIALDAARRDPAFGRSPARFFRKRAWDASSPDYSDIAGLGIFPMRAAQPMMTMAPVPRTRRPFLPARVRLRQRRLRGLGDFDWSQLPNLITAGETGAANIIAATRANPYNLMPTTAVPTFYQGRPIANQNYPPASTEFFGISTSTWLLIGLGAGVLLAARSR